MKLNLWGYFIIGKGVAPPAGAWIETYNCSCKRLCLCVAPPAGAWIETTPT